MTIGCSLTAAACFTGGGLLMKPAAGLSRIIPTIGVLVLFVVGAALLAVAVNRDGEVGSTYLVVVGLETVLAFALGVALYGEELTAPRVAAVLLVMSGTAILAAGGGV
jgi:multidrug transporter EmrE-like cation transporter